MAEEDSCSIGLVYASLVERVVRGCSMGLHGHEGVEALTWLTNERLCPVTVAGTATMERRDGE